MVFPLELDVQGLTIINHASKLRGHRFVPHVSARGRALVRGEHAKESTRSQPRAAEFAAERLRSSARKLDTPMRKLKKTR
jgi:hypothetical protein